MQIEQTISEWKTRPVISTGNNHPIKRGEKRIQAIVRTDRGLVTRHVDVKS